MKVICNQTEFSNNLSIVCRAVPSRPTHPVLGNILLTADKESQQITLATFDLSIGIKTTWTAQVEIGGKITIPAKLLDEIVSRLPNGEITICCNSEKSEDDDEQHIITISCAVGQYQLRGMEANEFPELPIIKNGTSVQLSAEALLDGLRVALSASSSDECKQVLTGVHITLENECLELAATDGHRLAVVKTSTQDETSLEEPVESQKLEFTVPARGLRELERLLSNSDREGIVTLHIEEGQIVFEGGEGQYLTSRTLEGDYPPYRQLLPLHFQRHVTIPRRTLLSAVERIAILSNLKNNVVKFNIDEYEQQIMVSIEAQDIGNGQESMPAQISGESLNIAFNIKYMIDGLKALSTSDVQLQLNSPHSPAILTPLGSKRTVKYLIMPVQIRNA